MRGERGPAERDEAEVGRCTLRLLLLDAAEIFVDQRLRIVSDMSVGVEHARVDSKGAKTPGTASVGSSSWGRSPERTVRMHSFAARCYLTVHYNCASLSSNLHGFKGGGPSKTAQQQRSWCPAHAPAEGSTAPRWAPATRGSSRTRRTDQPAMISRLTHQTSPSGGLT